MKKKCNICGKEVEAQGLGGHIWGIHGIRVGTRYEIEELKKKIKELEKYIDRRIENINKKMDYTKDPQFLLKILNFLEDTTNIKIKPTKEAINKWRIPIRLK